MSAEGNQQSAISNQQSPSTHHSPLTTHSLLVTLATYNERENLPELFRAIIAVEPNLEILVIDDNSPDGTGELADQMAAADPRIHVLHRPGKLGLGTATVIERLG